MATKRAVNVVAGPPSGNGTLATRFARARPRWRRVWMKPSQSLSGPSVAVTWMSENSGAR